MTLSAAVTMPVSGGRLGRSVHFSRPEAPLQIAQVAVPDPAPGTLLVKLHMAGICGSDIHRLAGDLPFSGEPVCFGHEAVGEVVAVGAGAGTDSTGMALEIGDRVYWFPVALCGTCKPCRDNESVSFCEAFVWPLPADKPNAAAFQDYATLAAGVPVYWIPEHVSAPALIAFGCAMPTAIGGFQRLGAVCGTVVVQGTGPLGLAAIVLAVRAGARVIAIGEPEGRLAIARKLGAFEAISLLGTSPVGRKARIFALTEGRGADAVIEAAGHVSAFNEGIDLLAVGGRYLVMGLYSGASTTPVNPVIINNRNLTIIGSLGYPREALAQTVALAAELGAALDFAGLVTHRFPLDKAAEAIALAARGEGVKVVLTGS